MKIITSRFKNTKGVEVFLHKNTFATVEEARNGRLYLVSCVDQKDFETRKGFYKKIQEEINFINK